MKKDNKRKNTKIVTLKELSQSSSEKVTTKKYFSGKFLSILIFSLIFFLLVIFVYLLGKRFNIAYVNGKPITRIQLYKELVKRNGDAVLEELVTKELILQEAEKRNIEISQDVVDQELSIIERSITDQGSTLQEILDYQNVTYDELLENIRIQKILEEILKDEISVTDQEMEERFEKNISFYGSNTKYEDVKEDIRLQIFQEKISASYKIWIEQVKNSSKINTNL